MIIKNLVIIAKIMPSLSYEVFIFLGDIIRNPKVDHIIRVDAVESIVEIIPNLTAEAFTFLKEIMINTSTEYKVNYAAIQGLAGIIKLQPSLAEEAFIFLKEVIISSNYKVNFEAGDNIIEIVKIKPTYEAFILLKELVMSSNIDDYNKYAIVANLGEIVKALPSLIPEAVTFLEEIVTNPKCNVDYTIVDKLPKIVKIMPSLTMEAFFISENMLTINDDYFFKAIVIDNMVNIAKINPNIIEEVSKLTLCLM